MSVRPRSIAAAIADGSIGSKSAAGSAITSGSDETAEQIAGHPQAAASATGRPNPSSIDGITDSAAVWSRRTIRSSSMPPVNSTVSSHPASTAHSSHCSRTLGGTSATTDSR